MEQLRPDNIRSEIVTFQQLISSRNLVEIDKRQLVLTAYLESSDAEDAPRLLLFVKGISFHSSAQYKEALNHFSQCLSLSENDPELRGIAHMGFGFSQRSLGNLDEAVSNLFSSIELIEKGIHFKSCLAFCYYQLGEVHISINENEKAIEYFNRILGLSTPHDFLLFRIHSGLAGCHQSMKNYEKCREHLTKSLQVPNLSLPLVSRGQNDLGALLLELKEYEEAEKLLLSSLKTREEIQQEDAASTSMIYLAEVYFEQGKFSEALVLLNRAEIIAEKYGAKLKLIKILSLLARLHTSNENYKAANKYYERYITLQTEVKAEQERNIFKLKNEQIEKQKKVITEKHDQLMATFDEIKRLKIDRRADFFSWVTVIALVLISEIFIDPLIENYAYNNLWSLAIKVFIALLFKPLDGMYEKILMDKALKKVN